jgi:hypothetical protein
LADGIGGLADGIGGLSVVINPCIVFTHAMPCHTIFSQRKMPYLPETKSKAPVVVFRHR